jgi:multidrug resistance efflux pump
MVENSERLQAAQDKLEQAKASLLSPSSQVDAPQNLLERLKVLRNSGTLNFEQFSDVFYTLRDPATRTTREVEIAEKLGELGYSCFDDQDLFDVLQAEGEHYEQQHGPA